MSYDRLVRHALLGLAAVSFGASSAVAGDTCYKSSKGKTVCVATAPKPTGGCGAGKPCTVGYASLQGSNSKPDTVMAPASALAKAPKGEASSAAKSGPVDASKLSTDKLDASALQQAGPQ